MTVVPGGFDEDPPPVGVAGLGDGAAVSGAAGGVKTGHQANEAHQFARGAEAVEVLDLGQQGEGGQGL